eukprot:729407-Hanusia_phi.AAC.1
MAGKRRKEERQMRDSQEAAILQQEAYFSSLSPESLSDRLIAVCVDPHLPVCVKTLRQAAVLDSSEDEVSLVPVETHRNHVASLGLAGSRRLCRPSLPSPAKQEHGPLDFLRRGVD